MQILEEKWKLNKELEQQRNKAERERDDLLDEKKELLRNAAKMDKKYRDLQAENDEA